MSSILLYPSDPKQRRSTITRDVLAVLAIVLLVWLGRRIYRLVDDLRVVTDAIGDTGTSVQNGFGSAADALAGIPVVGDDLASALGSAGELSGGNVVSLALTGDTAIHRLALALGLLTFAIPTLILLLLYIPMRVGQMRRVGAATAVFRDAADPERRRLLAMRAAMSLPVDELLKYTSDPIGDLIREEHDDLVRALLVDAGLRAA
jgi:hypothetical protein